MEEREWWLVAQIEHIVTEHTVGTGDLNTTTGGLLTINVLDLQITHYLTTFSLVIGLIQRVSSLKISTPTV